MPCAKSAFLLITIKGLFLKNKGVRNNLRFYGIIIALLWFAGVNSAQAQTCTPVSATLLGSADDELEIWINGNGPYPSSGPISYLTAGGASGYSPISLPVAAFNTTGTNTIAVLNQNLTASVVEASWVIQINCSSGQVQYITSADPTLKMYDSVDAGCASGPPAPSPPPDGGGNAWYSPNYTLSSTYFTTTPTVVTNPAGVWLQPIYNPVTGLLQPWISVNNTGTDNSACEGLYYRDVVTINPQPYIPPSFSITKSANPTTIAKSYSAGTIAYKLVVCNGGAAINTPVTIYDNLQYNIGAYYSGPTYNFSPPNQIFYNAGAGQYGSPTQFIFPDGFVGNGACVTITYNMSMGDTMDAAVTTCTLINQAAVTYALTPAYGTAAVTISGCAASANTSTSTSTHTQTNTPTKTNTQTSTPTVTYTQTATFTRTPTNSITPSPTSTMTNTVTNTATVLNTNTSTDTSTQTVTRTQTNTITASPTSTMTNTMTDTVVNTNTQTATVTQTNTNSATLVNTATFTNTRTNTNTITPSPTNTNTATNTETLVNSATNTPSVTNTNSTTPSPTNTNTATSTDTLADTATMTNTVTVTNTHTDTATSTPTLFNTATNTSTNTSTSSWTPTATNTDTTLNTFTPTSTRTSTATATNTNSVTSTRTGTSTSTVTATQTSTNTPVSSVSMVKIASETQAQSGDTITYGITLNVNGNVLNNPVVTDMLPSGITFYLVGNYPTGTSFSNNNGTLTWILPPALAPGTYTLTYKAKVNNFAMADVPLTNHAQLNYSGGPTLNAYAPVTVIGNFSIGINIYNSAGEVIRTIPIQHFSTAITNITLSTTNTITSLQGPGSSINILFNGYVIGTWDGNNNQGQPVGNGSYRVQIDNIAASGTVTSVSQNAIVNRSIAQAEVDIFNQAGEVVRRLYNVLSNPIGSSMTNVTLSAHAFIPSVSAPVSSFGSADSQLRIVIQDTSSPVTLSWDGSTDSGTFVTPGEYQVQVHWTDGNGNSTNITRTVLVLSTPSASGVVLAEPNELKGPNPSTTITAAGVSGAASLKVRIYTLAGELVQTLTSASTSLTWTPPGLASGLYIASVEVDNASGVVLTHQHLKLLILH